MSHNGIDSNTQKLLSMPRTYHTARLVRGTYDDCWGGSRTDDVLDDCWGGSRTDDVLDDCWGGSRTDDVLDDCWGGSRTDNVLDDNDASLRYGSEHDESEKRLSMISFLSLLAALISLNRRFERGQ